MILIVYLRRYAAYLYCCLIIIIYKLICANVLFLTVLQKVNNTVSLGKMADAQRCVLRQYTIQANKLIYFDIQISEGERCSKQHNFLIC